MRRFTRIGLEARVGKGGSEFCGATVAWAVSGQETNQTGREDMSLYRRELRASQQQRRTLLMTWGGDSYSRRGGALQDAYLSLPLDAYSKSHPSPLA